MKILIYIALLIFCTVSKAEENKPRCYFYVGQKFYTQKTLQGNFDVRLQAGFKATKLETSLAYRFFSDYGYELISAGVSYAVIDKKLSIVPGFEQYFTLSKSLQGLGPLALNIELRYNTKGLFSFSYTRVYYIDNRFSNYFSLTYRFINIKEWP